MNANELMIGDWVSYKGKMPCKITAICKDTVVVDNDTAQDWRIDFDKLTPISLTAEILEKNGFVKQWNNNWQFNDYHSIIISEDFYIAIFELSTRLDYVHELQHALRLAGIEKEIKL